MAKLSDSILQNQSNATSRLIKAGTLFSDDYETATETKGVFGSIAIIKCGNVTINSDELDLEFDIDFDDNLESNESDIIVYNLSDNTIAQIKVDSNITIEAGYTGDTGLIFSGKVTKVSTVEENADKITTIKVTNSVDKELEEMTFSATTASTILDELLKKTGLAVVKGDYPNDYTYENDVTLDGTLEANIKKYSEVCGVSCFVHNGKIHCKSVKKAFDVCFTVSEDTGMIGSPSPFSETQQIEDREETVNGFDIEMLMQYRVAVGYGIKLKSKRYNGTYYIKSGRHTFNESECITKIKVI